MKSGLFTFQLAGNSHASEGDMMLPALVAMAQCSPQLRECVQLSKVRSSTARGRVNAWSVSDVSKALYVPSKRPGTDYAVTWRYFPVTGTVSFEVTVSTKCLLRAAYHHHKHTVARYNKPINSSVGKIPRLGAERYRVQVLAGTVSCFFLQTVQIGSGAHRASYLTGAGFFSLVVDWGVKPTTQIHITSRLRMSGAITLFPLYAFTHSTGTTLGL